MRDVVIWNKALDLDEVKAHAARTDHPQTGEVWLPVAGLNDGDSVSVQSGNCSAAALRLEPDSRFSQLRNPPGTLLAPGT